MRNNTGDVPKRYTPSSVTCPICNKGYTVMQDQSCGTGDFPKCPYCQYLDGQRIVLGEMTKDKVLILQSGGNLVNVGQVNSNESMGLRRKMYEYYKHVI